MFWGLIMEPKRRYTQTVQKAFHVSKAALDLYNCDDEPTQLILTYNSRNYLLCTLQKDKILQCSLNLNFNVGDVICFATNGKCNVHLSGYLVEQDFEEDDEVSEDEEVIALAGKKRKTATSAQQPKKKSKTEQLLDEVDNYDSEDDTTFDLQAAEEEEDDSDVDDEAEDDEDGEDDEDEDEDEVDDDGEASSLSEGEDEEEVVIPVAKAPVNGVSSKTAEKKKKKKEKQQQEQKNIEKSPKPDTPNKTPKNNAKKENAEQSQTPQKRNLEGGVIIQELKVGEGPPVKSGKMVQVYYEGRLKHNNKVFDSHKQGPGFKFRVGKQEVIKGWDVGLLGMKVGGKRRISCPPQMAYGQKGSPPVIPPNSTLIFEVELKNVN